MANEGDEPLMDWVANAPDPELLEAARRLFTAKVAEYDRRVDALYKVVRDRMVRPHASASALCVVDEGRTAERCVSFARTES